MRAQRSSGTVGGFCQMTTVTAGMVVTEIVERWRGVGASVLDTQDVGAVELEIGPDGVVGAPRLARPEQRRYWHAR